MFIKIERDLWVNSDNVTHASIGAIRDKDVVMVHFTDGQFVTIDCDSPGEASDLLLLLICDLGGDVFGSRYMYFEDSEG
jgi:hypothetical protein